MKKETVIYDSPVVDFLDTKDSDASDFETDLISKVVSDAMNKTPSKVKRINQNYIYDYYLATLEDETAVAVKFSLLLGDDTLENEFNTLVLVNQQYDGIAAPSPLHLIKTEEFVALIMTYEYAENLEDIEVNFLMKSMGTFASLLDTIHESDTTELPTFEEKMDFDKSLAEIESQVPSDIIEILQTGYGLNFKDMNRILGKLDTFIKDNYTPTHEVLCNANIRRSTVLCRNNMMKCVNFEDCFVGDIFLSLKMTAVNMGFYYNTTTEQNFLKDYLNVTRLPINKATFVEQYNEKDHVNEVIVFLGLLSKHIFHIITNGIENQEKLYRHFELYNHLRDEVKEILGEDIKITDKLFNQFMGNHIK